MDEFPKLRSLNIGWSTWEAQQVLVLQDPLRLSGGALMVPSTIAPVLALLDGTRDLDAVRIGFLLRTGVQLTPDQLQAFVQTLDDALLLENGRFQAAEAEVLLNYRSSPFRRPAFAGAGYPEDHKELQQVFDDYVVQAGPVSQAPDGRVVGVISPHIDYARGWQTYVDTWVRARVAVEAADLVILLGTDHVGTPGSLTPTKQNYATPWGELPTDATLINQLVDILGEQRALEEEVHHISEHSIELAAVWLHYVAGGKPKRILPLLCGADPLLVDSAHGDMGLLKDALAYLAGVAAQPGVLVVAAGDISHVGPAFGDPQPLDAPNKDRIRSLDDQWLQCACEGSSDLLAEHMRQHGDTTRICGASPIRYMLAMLNGVQGHMVAYDQCPADEDFGSLVSVAGVLFTD